VLPMLRPSRQVFIQQPHIPNCCLKSVNPT
jgi:hypothetical protein